MSAELNILNKYLKKMYPFIIEVESIENGYEGYDYDQGTNWSSAGMGRRTNFLKISIYVSPLHFCELMDDRVSKKLESIMVKQCSSLIKSIIPECNPDSVKFLFYPNVDKVTIFDDIPEE